MWALQSVSTARHAYLHPAIHCAPTRHQWTRTRQHQRLESRRQNETFQCAHARKDSRAHFAGASSVSSNDRMFALHPLRPHEDVAAAVVAYARMCLLAAGLDRLITIMAPEWRDRAAVMARTDQESNMASDCRSQQRHAMRESDSGKPTVCVVAFELWPVLHNERFDRRASMGM